MHIKIQLITLLFFMSCMPVSHVIVGEAKTPINPSSVKIYLDYPKEYEKIDPELFQEAAEQYILMLNELESSGKLNHRG